MTGLAAAALIIGLGLAIALAARLIEAIWK